MSALGRVLSQIGLETVANSHVDVKLLFAEKFVRLLAYGSSTLVLVLFLSVLGVSEARIGLFMTLTLLGDVGLSFVLTLFADGVGRRRILAAGALLMAFSGAVFASSSNYWLLVLASVFGVISPSGNEIGPFRAIEESTLVQLTPKDVRTDILSWYEVVGALGAAMGALAAGMLVQYLQLQRSWDPIEAYRCVFVLYSCLGLIKLAINFLLSESCEARAASYTRVDASSHEDSLIEPQEHRPDLMGRIISLIPSISPQSQDILKKLCILFSMDSFASGLVATSWLYYFFEKKFELEPKVLGTIFFTTSIVASISNIIAVPMAKRVGLVKTMVFTHLPSALFLAAIPIPPQVGVAALLLVLRSCTSSMDRAPRQAFLAAAVLPNERTAVMGFVNVLKTLAQSAGPLVTGWLVENDLFWLVFFAAGGLKAAYDLTILRLFLGFRGREESAPG